MQIEQAMTQIVGIKKSEFDSFVEKKSVLLRNQRGQKHTKQVLKLTKNVALIAKTT